MDIGYAKRLFITAKKSESVTISTLETYERGLKGFFDYLIAQNILDLTVVDTGTIREFLISLKDKGLRGITVHQYFRILRTFFKFLHQEDYLSKNPMVNVKPPKIAQKEMRTFNSQEISKILSAFDTEDFLGMRNYCIMCLG